MLAGRQDVLERAILRIADREKQHFACDLHDGLCQSLAGVAALTSALSHSNYSAFTQKIQEQSSWGITFLGIPLAGGDQSYYHATTSQNSNANTVTITMTPAGITTPVSPTDQLAYVIGAQILWPGAASP